MVTRLPLRALLAAALIVSLVLQSYLLYMPADGEGALPPGVDKVGHAMMFGGPLLLALVLGWRWAPMLAAVYAPVSEVVQGLPSVRRDPDWHDIVADVVGIIIVTLLEWFVARRRVR